MAPTEFQRTICRLLAAHRIESGESYVAGGVALNEIARELQATVDRLIFHPGPIGGAWPELKER